MKYSLLPAIALALFLLPAQARAEVVIDTDLAHSLYEMVDLDDSQASAASVYGVLNEMERPELEQLVNLLDAELSDAYAYYWAQTRQARNDGLEPDYSGWRGGFLPGVELEERDRLLMLLGYVQQRLGDT